jgi:hypothetical protein
MNKKEDDDILNAIRNSMKKNVLYLTPEYLIKGQFVGYS